jgi:hypothetical protein
MCGPGMGKKGKVKSNPHSKIGPIMPGHWKFAYWWSFKSRIWTRWEKKIRSLPGSVLDFKLKLEDLDRSKQIGPLNISF